MLLVKLLLLEPWPLARLVLDLIWLGECNLLDDEIDDGWIIWRGKFEEEGEEEEEDVPGDENDLLGDDTSTNDFSLHPKQFFSQDGLNKLSATTKSQYQGLCWINDSFESNELFFVQLVNTWAVATVFFLAKYVVVNLDDLLFDSVEEVNDDNVPWLVPSTKDNFTCWVFTSNWKAFNGFIKKTIAITRINNNCTRLQRVLFTTSKLLVVNWITFLATNDLQDLRFLQLTDEKEDGGPGDEVGDAARGGGGGGDVTAAAGGGDGALGIGACGNDRRRCRRRRSALAAATGGDGNGGKSSDASIGDWCEGGKLYLFTQNRLVVILSLNLQFTQVLLLISQEGDWVKEWKRE